MSVVTTSSSIKFEVITSIFASVDDISLKKKHIHSQRKNIPSVILEVIVLIFDINF